jgi:UDP-N-acetylmuramoyl-L-alanyl-D-glutamate--2,6-diaminopimelate ligase
MQLSEVARLLRACLLAPLLAPNGAPVEPPGTGAGGTGLAPQSEGAGVQVADLAYDSRAVVPGSLFFCLPGESDDGHRWAAEAVRAGAVALVCERPVAAEVPQLVVASARQAMNQLAAPFFGHPSRALTLVGVTGTNGKTTTAYMLESIFAAAGMYTGLVGTVETRIRGRSGQRRTPGSRTTPESVDLQRLLASMVDDGVTHCAMEVTSIGLAQGRVDGAEFSSAMFTNLTQDHLDYHGDLESYYRSKRALFAPRFLPGSHAFALVNVDDSYGVRLAAELAGAEPALRRVTVGLGGAAGQPEARAETVQAGVAGSRVRMVAPAGEVLAEGMDDVVTVALPGAFNVANALAAAVCARGLGVDPAAVAEGLAGLPRIPGRFELVEEGQPFAVVVDYAHTPDGLARVLAAARDLTAAAGGAAGAAGAPKVIAVFGAGGDRDRGKRPLMGQAAAEAADLVFVTSDNPRSEDPEAIMAGVAEGIAPAPPPLGYRLVADRAAAIAEALGAAGPGDVVVIAGKGHETTQTFADRIVHFDDVDVARGLLRARGSR